MPAVLLARLGVDERAQGKGLGRHLLSDAIRRIASVGSDIGIEVVVCHAYDEQAAAFYARYGFTAFVTNHLHLFMPMKTVIATVNATQ
ncbi:Predicted acetyltransferase [Propionibacterium australiense]|uniref:GNAT family N-acetyltransferase n=1 Tax=Propionibacterium australiense TaxID=119981 RepID=A0A383S6V0_9ACTN|nr:GNAT family N-acetyltransferase [Propionibacterium australiense]RLP07663.1 GNAT family N-acetyltransferase [Propionibacterium australiense]RLP08090.1 GNAT family N-acetyltransferase [Propionibacterium australiense]SYZ33708.1 Gcn5-related N-acetyltransferase (GNAT) domain profile [Propionibacterium australiense]VEH92859.1 Predicted acetyltransferase [Propionibacterium australiense]